MPTKALYDIQIKRIHEYKRQHLNMFSVISRYLDIKKMSKDEKKEVSVNVFDQPPDQLVCFQNAVAANCCSVCCFIFIVLCQLVVTNATPLPSCRLWCVCHEQAPVSPLFDGDAFYSCD